MTDRGERKLDDPDRSWLLEGARRDRQSITREWIPHDQKTIDGVAIVEAKPVVTSYGHLVEILRAEWLVGTQGVDQIFRSTFEPAAISAWHAHESTSDRLSVLAGTLLVVLYDARPGSPTHGLLNQFRLSALRPALLVVPPRIWHGVKNVGHQPACLLNAVDRAYAYENPDHWRTPPDTPAIPFRF